MLTLEMVNRTILNATPHRLKLKVPIGERGLKLRAMFDNKCRKRRLILPLSGFCIFDRNHRKNIYSKCRLIVECFYVKRLLCNTVLLYAAAYCKYIT